MTKSKTKTVAKADPTKKSIKPSEQQVDVAQMVRDNIKKMNGFHEFVIKIDMSMAAPIVNTGYYIPVKHGKTIQYYCVIDMQEFSSFMNVNELLQIQKCLTNGSDKSIQAIYKIRPTLKIASITEGVTENILMDPTSAASVFGMFNYDSYRNCRYSRLNGAPISFHNFIGRCHIYVNQLPAGLKAGTTIKVFGFNMSSIEVASVKPEFRQTLYDFNPTSKEIIVQNEVNKAKFYAPAAVFDFESEYANKQSIQVGNLVNFLKVIEAQSADK